jgi:hypothetical protein
MAETRLVEPTNSASALAKQSGLSLGNPTSCDRIIGLFELYNGS